MGQHRQNRAWYNGQGQPIRLGGLSQIDQKGVPHSVNEPQKGECLDNAPMESFFASLKRELVHRQRFRTRVQAKAAILHSHGLQVNYCRAMEYIEVFYNRQGRHSCIGSITKLPGFRDEVQSYLAMDNLTQLRLLSYQKGKNKEGELSVVKPIMSTEFTSGLVSVIIPTFNRKKLVQQALASVARQSWSSIEIIVVDDGSTDGTSDQLNIWRDENPTITVTVLRQNNVGVAAARNAGLAHAAGEFIYFLDSDDLIFPHALETLVKTMLKGDSPYSLAHIHSSDENGGIIKGNITGISNQFGPNILDHIWMTHAALYKRSTLFASGSFNETLMVGEDSEFQWRVLIKVGPGALTSRYIGLRRQHSFGHLSLNRTDMQAQRHSLEAQLAFKKWLEAEGLRKQHVGLRQRASIIGMAIRFGDAGDWASKNRAMFLLMNNCNQRSFWQRAMKILGKPNWRPYYVLLLSIFNGAKCIRSAYHSILYLRHQFQSSDERRLSQQLVILNTPSATNSIGRSVPSVTTKLSGNTAPVNNGVKTGDVEEQK